MNIQEQITYVSALPKSDMHDAILDSLNKLLPKQNETARQTLDRFCLTLQIEKAVLISSHRGKPYPDYRKMLSYYLSDRFTRVQISEVLNRDHSSITFYIKKHHDLYRLDKNYKIIYDFFVKSL
jgi:hypothetical protein